MGLNKRHSSNTTRHTLCVTAIFFFILSLQIFALGGGGSDGGGEDSTPTFLDAAHLILDQLKVDRQFSEKILDLPLSEYEDALTTPVKCAYGKIQLHLTSHQLRAYFIRSPQERRNQIQFGLIEKDSTIYIDCPYWENFSNNDLTLGLKINVFHEYMRVKNREKDQPTQHSYTYSMRLRDIPAITSDDDVICKAFYKRDFGHLKQRYENYLRCDSTIKAVLTKELKETGGGFNWNIEKTTLNEAILQQHQNDLALFLFQVLSTTDISYTLVLDLDEYFQHHLINRFFSQRPFGFLWKPYNIGLLGCFGFQAQRAGRWAAYRNTYTDSFSVFEDDDIPYRDEICFGINNFSQENLEICSFPGDSSAITGYRLEDRPNRYCSQFLVKQPKTPSMVFELVSQGFEIRRPEIEKLCTESHFFKDDFPAVIPLTAKPQDMVSWIRYHRATGYDTTYLRCLTNADRPTSQGK